MTRKPLAPSSFQQRVVKFLENNASDKFTAKEILEEINKTLDSPKTDGSMSGTLAVLCKDGWVNRSDDYPTRYSYQSENDDARPVIQPLHGSECPNVNMRQRNSLQSTLKSKIDAYKSKISSIDTQIDQLQNEKAFLEGQLELAEELLSQAEF